MSISLPVLGVPGVLGGGDTLANQIAALLAKYGNVCWQLQEPAASGSVALATNPANAGLGILASSAYPGAELFTDGDMEAADTSAWSKTASAALTKETTAPHGGSRCLRVTENGGANPYVWQTIFTVGKRYRLTGYARSDGNATPRIYSPTMGFVWTGTTSTSWQSFDFEFTAAETAFPALFTIAGSGTGYYTEWDDVSAKEANPLNGDITSATTGQDAGSRLGKAYLFDGVNDYVDIYSAALNTLFDDGVGALSVFAKVSGAGVWTDNAQRVLVKMGADVNTYISIEKNTSNELEWNYCAGGTLETVTLAVTPSGFFQAGIAWTNPGFGMRAIYNGVQTGSDQSVAGTWAGALDSALCVIGASSTTVANVWSGLIAWVPFLGAVPTAGDWLSLAQSGGVT